MAWHGYASSCFDNTFPALEETKTFVTQPDHMAGRTLFDRIVLLLEKRRGIAFHVRARHAWAINGLRHLFKRIYRDYPILAGRLSL